MEEVDMEESSRASILIVDDSTTNIRVVSNIVKHLNYKIHIAKSGIQALNLLSKLNPDIILMDIQMPNMNGFECCERVTSILSPLSVPVIFLSGSNDENDKRKAKAAGGTAYITKPIDAEELVETIDLHLAVANS